VRGGLRGAARSLRIRVLSARRALATSALVLAIAAIDPAAAGPGLGTTRILLAGEPEVVFDWSTDRCAPYDIPDAPTRAFRDASGRVVLMASHDVSRRMIGTSLDSLRHPCSITMRSHYSADPARFDDRQWIGATHTSDGRRVYALVHDEYHGQRHRGRCRSHVRRRCWYNAITLAVSDNGGRSFHRRRPPRHLVASIPYRYREGRRPRGIFSPSNIVYRSADRHYYSFVHREGYGAGAAGSCLMRTRKPWAAKSWRAWGGEGFTVRFVNPYASRVRHPSRHDCRPVAPGAIATMSDSLTYNTYLKAYVLVGVSGDVNPRRNELRPGVFFALSPDLIHWTRRKLLMRKELPWTFKCGDRDPILYPSIIDPLSRTRNFGSTGQHAYLYFTRFNRASNCRQSLDRDLLRVPITFQR
jgi:hypothetical protein